jgi:hypothetical protein
LNRGAPAGVPFRDARSAAAPVNRQPEGTPMIRRLLPPGLLALLLAPCVALAQDPPANAENGERATLRVAALDIDAAGLEPPDLDGRLDDPVWAQAQPLTDFIQRDPNPGQPSAFRTVGKVAFDDEAIYVAIEAFDPEPDKIVGRLARRDDMPSSDILAFMLDSDRDRRTGYMFMVNPREVEADAIVANNQDDDFRWDAVWDVEAEVTDQGWVAEFRVPLSMLRFSEGQDAWGLQVGRIVQRIDETSFWSPFPPQDPGVVTHFGELTGVARLDSPRRLEILPYTLAQVDRGPGDPADPFFESSDWKLSGGLDLKYGLTSNLTLDATINPDFGQVEADPSQVNLSAFETFFEERRPFFIEGADIFTMSLGVGDGDVETLFYTRRIGRGPQGRADADGGYLDAPFQTSILGATKVSGRTAGGWSIGVLDAVTAEETADVLTGAGERLDPVVEPLTNYAVMRLRKDFREGATQVGLMGTSMERWLEDTGLEDVLRRSAWSGGMDLQHRFHDDELAFNAKVMGTTVRGSEEAILRTQLSSARFFQRPDVTHVHVDSARTSLSGWSTVMEVQKQAGGPWRAAGFFQARSPGFETNDIGFMRETDYLGGGAFLGYRIVEPTWIVRRAGVNLNLHNFWNFDGMLTARGGNINGNAQFTNFWFAFFGVGGSVENWSTDALRGGPNIREPGDQFGWIGFESDDRKAVQFNAELEGGRENETGGRWWEIDAGIAWQVDEGTRVALYPFYRKERGGWQFVATPSDLGGDTRYVFADIDQRTFATVFRIERTFTPRLSLQVYAQPFVATGSYAEFKEVVDPRADAFDDRLHVFDPEGVALVDGSYEVDANGDGATDFSFGAPDFNVREFRSNVVLRWEYRPGSTLFAVWQQSRDSFHSDPRFQLGQDLDDLFHAHPRNVFLLKVNGWLNL